MMSVHPAWLPSDAWRPVGSRRVRVRGDGILVGTVRDEVAQACARFGGTVERRLGGDADLVLELAAGVQGDEGFGLTRRGGATVVSADRPAGLLYGLFEVVRQGESAFGPRLRVGEYRPAMRCRMLDHWDNVEVPPVMGQVERGYAGGSLFWQDGRMRDGLDRVRDYGRLPAACGINAVSVNHLNVHEAETHLLTGRLGEVAAIAGALRRYGVRVHLSVNFAAPVVLGALPTADPLDEGVRARWIEATRRVYEAIPDFGGYVVEADSEGRPGPFAYGRSHADGANMLAEAVAPFGGLVDGRAFVYNHRQDWRDRSTDRARAAYDHFAPLDGQFLPNASSVESMGTGDNARVLQSGDTGIADHRRTLVANSDGSYRIRNDNSGKVLAILNGSSTAGTQAVQFSDNGSAKNNGRLVQVS